MLALTGLEHFYYIPGCTDMRYGYRKLAEIVRHKFLRNQMNGDVYIFMNKQKTTVRMFLLENHAFYIQEKRYTDGYNFMKLEIEDDSKSYYISWQELKADNEFLRNLLKEKEDKLVYPAKTGSCPATAEQQLQADRVSDINDYSAAFDHIKARTKESCKQ